jgi:predicted GTPase
VKPSKLDTRKRDLAKAASLERGDVMWVSSSKGTGIDALAQNVRALLSV